VPKRCCCSCSKASIGCTPVPYIILGVFHKPDDFQIGGVIRNPEVQKLVKPLLLAIANPNKHAKAALDILLQTVFINTVDAPSLALIVPVVHRGLRDRSGDAKKKAARIVGNMCALINEPKVLKLTPSTHHELTECQLSCHYVWLQAVQNITRINSSLTQMISLAMRIQQEV